MGEGGFREGSESEANRVKGERIVPTDSKSHGRARAHLNGSQTPLVEGYILANETSHAINDRRICHGPWRIRIPINLGSGACKVENCALLSPVDSHRQGDWAAVIHEIDSGYRANFRQAAGQAKTFEHVPHSMFCVDLPE
jgi:hypothetical protein